jgi:hypothetical protein
MSTDDDENIISSKEQVNSMPEPGLQNGTDKIKILVVEDLNHPVAI